MDVTLLELTDAIERRKEFSRLLMSEDDANSFVKVHVLAYCLETCRDDASFIATHEALTRLAGETMSGSFLRWLVQMVLTLGYLKAVDDVHTEKMVL